CGGERDANSATRAGCERGTTIVVLREFTCVRPSKSNRRDGQWSAAAVGQGWVVEPKLRGAGESPPPGNCIPATPWGSFPTVIVDVTLLVFVLITETVSPIAPAAPASVT